MDLENRKFTRYDDVARVEAPEICIFPGVLLDVSKKGCKIRFPVPVQPDMDRDYELKLTPTRKSKFQSFVLIGHPMWNCEDTSYSELGFEILHSPGIRLFNEYLNDLAETENEFNEELEITESLCQ